jgi:hypothetical protein
LSPHRRLLTEFARLPLRDRLLLLQAWLELTLLRPELRFRSLPRLWERTERRARRRAGRPAPAPERIARTAWLVEVAGRYTWPRATCLTQALATARLLADRGVATRLQIGVQMQGRALHAHAWLEREGRPLTPMPAGADYRPLEPAGGAPY